MSSNVAILRSPTTVRRRSLCGSSHDRCRWATIPEGKRRKQKTTSCDAVAHVAGALRGALGRLLADQVQRDRDVVRAEAPQRVLVRAQHAEVQAVAVQVVQRPQLVGRRSAPSGAPRRGGTRAGAPPSAPARPARRPARRLRRRPRSSPAASPRSSACRPARRRSRARRASARASPARPRRARRPRAGRSARRSRGPPGTSVASRARAASSASHSQRSSQPSIAPRLRARLGPQ